MPNSVSITAAVTEEERVHLHLETGCPCQPGSSYLQYQMPDLPETTHSLCQQSYHTYYDVA